MSSAGDAQALLGGGCVEGGGGGDPAPWGWGGVGRDSGECRPGRDTARGRRGARFEGVYVCVCVFLPDSLVRSLFKMSCPK